ncbi:MAG: hypothetical protein SFV15_21990 [Polyangiaceae bacterium]|nr:hypothetical protein [Polyangiaceae bacterium]
MSTCRAGYDLLPLTGSLIGGTNSLAGFGPSFGGIASGSALGSGGGASGSLGGAFGMVGGSGGSGGAGAAGGSTGGMPAVGGGGVSVGGSSGPGGSNMFGGGAGAGSSGGSAGSSGAGASTSGGTGGVPVAPAGAPTMAWAKVFGGVNDDEVLSLSLDPQGDVVICGAFNGTSSFGGANFIATVSDGFLAKYDASGNHLWSRQAMSPVFDSADRVSTLGSSVAFSLSAQSGQITLGALQVNTGTGGGAFGVLNSAGQPQWLKSAVPSTGANVSAFGSSQNRLYLYGAHTGNLDLGGNILMDATLGSGFVAVFDPLGAFIGGSSIPGYYWNAVLDGPTNIIAVGREWDVSGHAALATYTQAGVLSGATSFTGNSHQEFDAAAMDANGNVYAVGFGAGNMFEFGGPTLSSAGGEDIIVASYTSALSHRWSKSFGANSNDRANAVATDLAGNVYVVGQQFGVVNFGAGPCGAAGVSSMFLVSLTSNGTVRWSQCYVGTSGVAAVSVAADFSIYLGITLETTLDVLGQGFSPVGGAKSDAMILKLTPTP